MKYFKLNFFSILLYIYIQYLEIFFEMKRPKKV